MLTKIKPCPFCGGEGRRSYYGEWRYIVCRECGAKSKSLSVVEERAKDNRDIYEKVIEFWNERKPVADSNDYGLGE